MKKQLLAVLAGAMLMMATSAMAYPVKAGDTITMLNGDNNNIQYEGQYQYTVGAGTVKYGAFCLEKNEYFTSGGQYKVQNLSAYAENGGVGGATDNKDPLSNETKWLFSHFLTGDILDVTGVAENDHSMQLAVWYLEDEITFGLDSAASIYVNKARLNASEAANYDIVAMNLVDGNGKFAQSQLVGNVPVPEPSTMVLLGAGMLGLAIFGKRRMNKDA